MIEDSESIRERCNTSQSLKQSQANQSRRDATHRKALQQKSLASDLEDSAKALAASETEYQSLKNQHQQTLRALTADHKAALQHLREAHLSGLARELDKAAKLANTQHKKELKAFDEHVAGGSC